MDKSDLDSLASALASTCRSAAHCAAESMQHPVETSGDFLYLNIQQEKMNGTACTMTLACSWIGCWTMGYREPHPEFPVSGAWLAPKSPSGNHSVATPF